MVNGIILMMPEHNRLMQMTLYQKKLIYYFIKGIINRNFNLICNGGKRKRMDRYNLIINNFRMF